MGLVLLTNMKMNMNIKSFDHTTGRGLRGFSLIEALIGAALLLLVVLGILPLFTRAMMDNTAGADYTRLTSFAKSKAEDFNRIPWANTTYSVPAGQTSLVFNEYLDPVTNIWKTTPGSGAPAPAQWTRTTTIRHYLLPDTIATAPSVTINDPVNGTVGAYILDPASAIDGGGNAHVKEVEVRIQNVAPTGPLGGRRQAIFRYWKAF
jgi:hypothetical protein